MKDTQSNKDSLMPPLVNSCINEAYLQNSDDKVVLDKEVSLNNRLLVLANNYSAGNVRNHVKFWETLTSDPNVINIIKYGLVLKFDSFPSPRPPFVYNLNSTDASLVDSEVASLLTKGAIQPTSVYEDDYFSPVFPRINKDGSARLLLNLSSLNEHVQHQHFKMESFKDVRYMVTRGCWMASVDLKSAFYSIPVHPKHQKYLKKILEETLCFCGHA